MLCVHRSTIANYEMGRRTPSMAELQRIAEFYSVSLDYFSDGTNTDASFEISSRVINYFKDVDKSDDDKVELFNDILSAYYLYVLDKK